MGGIWLVIPYLGLCIAIGFWALKKGQNSLLWFVAALILSPLAGLLLFFVKAKPQQPSQPLAGPPDDNAA